MYIYINMKKEGGGDLERKAWSQLHHCELDQC